MQSLLVRLRSWWETADRTQKTVTLIGGGLLIVMLFGTFMMATKPKMAPLFVGLTPADQGMVMAELQKMAVPTEVDRQGNIMVPDNQIAELTARLAVAQKTPTSGKPGYANLDKMGIMNSPRVEQERLKVAVEEELGRSIERIQGVQSARVHLTMGEETAFLRDSKPPTASVVISEAPGSAIAPGQAKAISRLVQYAVNGLDEKNITVINSAGQLLIDGSDAAGVGGMAERKVAAEIAESKRRESELQRKLDIAFGPGNTVASIPVLQMNFDQKSSTEKTTSPSEGPLAVQSSEEVMGAAGGSATAGGIAGAASNTGTGAPASPTGAAGADGKNYKSIQKATEFGRSEKTTTLQTATGAITTMAVNVMVNSTVIKDDAPVKQYVQQYLGPWANSADNFSATVTSVPFDTTAKASRDKEDAASAGAAQKQQILSILPIVALIFVGFMVIKAIGKTARATDVVVAAMPGGGVMALTRGEANAQGATIMSGNAAGGVSRENLSQAIESAALQTGVVSEPVYDAAGNRVDPYATGSGSNLAFVQSGASVGPISTIQERINVPLEQIKKMSVDKPEGVAMLLKSWMLEEKR